MADPCQSATATAFPRPAASSLAPIELAFDSNVFSWVRVLFLILCLYDAEFFGAVGARSTNGVQRLSSRSRWRENAAKGSKEKRYNQVNENRQNYRQPKSFRLVFVIPKAFGVARLGEHNVSRRHESGFSVVREIRLWAF